MHMYGVEQALARVCRAYQGTRPAAKIAQEQAKAGICSLASACKHRKSSLIFSACSEVRYFYRGHDHAFTLNELKAQFRIAFEAFRTQNLYRWFFWFDLRMKDFYFKLRENWLIQYFTQMFGFFNSWKNESGFLLAIAPRHYPGIQYPFVHRWMLGLLKTCIFTNPGLYISATSLMIPSSMCNALQSKNTQVRWFQRKLLIHLRQRFRRNWTCWMLPKLFAKSRNALEGAYLGSPPSRGTLSPLETSSRDRFHGSKRQPRLFLMEECSTNSLADYKLARISNVWRNYFLARFVIW